MRDRTTCQGWILGDLRLVTSRSPKRELHASMGARPIRTSLKDIAGSPLALGTHASGYPIGNARPSSGSRYRSGSLTPRAGSRASARGFGPCRYARVGLRVGRCSAGFEVVSERLAGVLRGRLALDLLSQPASRTPSRLIDDHGPLQGTHVVRGRARLSPHSSAPRRSPKCAGMRVEGARTTYSSDFWRKKRMWAAGKSSSLPNTASPRRS